MLADLLGSDKREPSLQMCTWHPLSAPPPTPITEREDTGFQYQYYVVMLAILNQPYHLIL